MSVWDIFGGPKQQTQQAAPQPNPVQQTNQTGIPSGAGMSGNQGVVPVNPTTGANPPQNQQQEQANPMDAFVSLWNPQPAQDQQAGQNNQQQQTQQNNQQQTQQAQASATVPQSYIDLDANTVNQLAGKVNFMQNIPQDLRDRAMKGEPAAIMEMMNVVQQQGFAMALQVAGKLSNQAVTAGVKEVNGSFDSRFRDLSSRDVIYSGDTGKKYQHPAVAPIVESLRQQALQKNPHATDSEIQQTVEAYLTNLGGYLNTNQQTRNGGGNSIQDAQDFSKF